MRKSINKKEKNSESISLAIYVASPSSKIIHEPFCLPKKIQKQQRKYNNKNHINFMMRKKARNTEEKKKRGKEGKKIENFLVIHFNYLK